MHSLNCYNHVEIMVEATAPQTGLSLIEKETQLYDIRI